jgi:hypothetical protein
LERGAAERDGARGPISGKPDKPSINRSLVAVRDQVMALVRERYADFGPTLVAEKLVELHRNGQRTRSASHFPCKQGLRLEPAGPVDPEAERRLEQLYDAIRALAPLARTLVLLYLAPPLATHSVPARAAHPARKHAPPRR